MVNGQIGFRQQTSPTCINLTYSRRQLTADSVAKLSTLARRRILKKSALTTERLLTNPLNGCLRPIADIRVEQVEQSKAGRTSYSGLEVMKETQGKANPKQVNELLQKKLG